MQVIKGVPTPLEIVVGEIAKGYANALARLCECLRLRKEYAGDLELASVADTVMKALAEERPVEAGPVRVEVRKKILGRSLRAFLRGQEVDPDELLSKISQARSRAAWLQSDCSDSAILEPVYATNDRDAIEYAVRHLDELSNVCGGASLQLEGLDMPQYVKEGIKRGVERFLAGR
ncbi:MAG: hypothetical protein AT711_05945 [Thermoproteus sp. CIS_19]|nr:MAG: hypothetical protein AT711_05945 [Thermoproteus sp. CIS_19]